MTKREKAHQYLNSSLATSNIILVMLIVSIAISFLLIQYFALLYVVNMLLIILTGYYCYFYYKKFKFIGSMRRLLDSEDAEDRLIHLYENLGADLSNTIDNINTNKKYYMGERQYNRAASFTFTEKNIDYKIAKMLYNIYFNLNQEN